MHMYFYETSDILEVTNFLNQETQKLLCMNALLYTYIRI